ncbi:MAG: DUF1214 domain-containing protein [Alphaproteobacteria bacterium]|nr:DUF1214 domain-containing protein [Alphaproteobacteria bacterium]
MSKLSGPILGLAVALATGFGATFLALGEGGQQLGGLRSGPWTALPDTGEFMLNPYSNAYVARAALLQLGSAEGIRFVARTDSDGATLDRACRYLVAGRTPTAAMWTLYATDRENRVIGLEGRLAFFDSANVQRLADGGLEIRSGPQARAGQWLATPGEGPFQLVLNIYDPVPVSGASAKTVQMPAIIREGC